MKAESWRRVKPSGAVRNEFLGRKGGACGTSLQAEPSKRRWRFIGSLIVALASGGCSPPEAECSSHRVVWYIADGHCETPTRLRFVRGDGWCFCPRDLTQDGGAP